MADLTTGELQAVAVGDLPLAPDIYDDTLIPVEQGGEAKHMTGAQWKEYAKSGVNAYVTAAQDAAAKAEQAAQKAEDAASKIQDVSDDAAAAVAAAQAAESARAAAVSAQQAAEQAAALAAQQAAANVESTLQGYVSDAEKAKTDAQSAAGTAATDAVNSVNAQLSQHVSDAQAAQAAAEKARDEAQSIAGGNFASTDYVDQKAASAESNANKYTDEKIAAIPTPDVGEQIGAHNTDTDAHNDIRLLITELTTRFNALANSEDVDLDQLAELVTCIKDNRSLIEQITTNKVNVSDIIDNLTTNVSNKPLSAAQGVALKALIDAAANAASAAQSTADGKQSKITGSQGQVVGFDTSGNPVAQEAPSVSSVYHFFITIPTTGWTENSDTGVKSISIPVEGVTSAMNGNASPYYDGDKSSDSYAAFVEAKNQFLTYITNGDAETYDGGVTFNVYGDVPTVEIPVMVEVS